MMMMMTTTTTENLYSHIPKSVAEHEDVTVLWNQGVQMHRQVLANRTDITVKKWTNLLIYRCNNTITKECNTKGG
jgi:hypothetical protein